MYPGGIGDTRNHKRDHCDDGVTAKLAIPYPQPARIFTKGKHFNAAEFRNALCHLVPLALACHGAPDTRPTSPAMADLAFAQLLCERAQGEKDSPLRLLFDMSGLLWSPAIQLQIRVVEGKSFLVVELADLQ